MRLTVLIESDVIDLDRFDQLSFLDSPDGSAKVLYATRFSEPVPFDHPIAVFTRSQGSLEEFYAAEKSVREAIVSSVAFVILSGRPATQEVMESIGYAKPTGEDGSVEPKKVIARVSQGDSSLQEVKELIGQTITRVEFGGGVLAIISDGDEA